VLIVEGWCGTGVRRNKLPEKEPDRTRLSTLTQSSEDAFADLHSKNTGVGRPHWSPYRILLKCDWDALCELKESPLCIANGVTTVRAVVGLRRRRPGAKDEPRRALTRSS
jgi:hypothetical protein